MKFKVGDEVKILSANEDSDKIGEIRTVIKITESSIFLKDCRVSWSHPTDSLKLISKQSKIMKLNTMMKKLLDKDVRTLIKADYINGDLEFTVEGNKALTSILFEANKEELVKLAKEVIEEAKEEK